MEAELGYAMWAVEDKTTGAFVGQCGIRAIDEDYGPEIDLAYHYYPRTAPGRPGTRDTAPRR